MMSKYEAAGYRQLGEFLRLVERKKYPKAMKLIDKALVREDAKSDPGEPTALRSMLGMKAHLLHDMGLHAESLEFCDRHLETHLGDGGLLYVSALALCGLGRYHEALGRVNEAVTKRPDEPVWAAYRSTVLLGLGRMDDALAAADAALVLDPDHPFSQGKRAMVLVRMGRVDEAVSIARSNLARDRTHPEALEVMRIAGERGWERG